MYCFQLDIRKDGFYYYSIVRADGFNVQEWAKQRAERRRMWAASAEQKSNEYYEKSNQVRESQRISRRIEVRQISTGTRLFFDLCEEGG